MVVGWLYWCSSFSLRGIAGGVNYVPFSARRAVDWGGLPERLRNGAGIGEVRVPNLERVKFAASFGASFRGVAHGSPVSPNIAVQASQNAARNSAAVKMLLWSTLGTITFFRVGLFTTIGDDCG